MNTASEVKDMVRERYAQIAEQSRESNAASCCGVGAPCTTNIMVDSYAAIEGYNPDADLGLGCGLPTEFAQIREGDTVLDLGSGAGNDCFIARAETGPAGKVIGVDFTPSMIALARQKVEAKGFNNVEFRQGDIEDLPVTDNSVDVVVSNCVLNLVPDKAKVFSEIMRVLKPGGHFSISDVVVVGALPEGMQQSAELYAGCVSGAIQRDAYLDLIAEAGFEGVVVQKQKPILLPDDLLLQFLSMEEVHQFVASGTGIFSVTVFARKPGGDAAQTTKTKRPLRELTSAGCTPGSGCC
ncbi:MAG: arsenite methyltransferase [Saprospiraceae bacterium]|nr:arsenite methyltransferase [Saprospiraceae bacterium]